MLTPAFEICQDERFLTITIKARFARVSDTEIYVDGSEFKFYSKPYFLRLNLPGSLIEDGRESAKYDTDSGHYVVKIPKETKDEHFEGLDMLTKLLAPTGSASASQPLIEVIAETSNKGGQGEEEEEEEDFDWQVSQEPFTMDEKAIVSGVYYGFANKRSGVFQRLQEELSQVVDVPDPDKTSNHDRGPLKVQSELDAFSDDHYLADLFQDDMIQTLMKYKPYWTTEENIKFSDEENEQLLKLPKKQYLLGKDEEKVLLYGLVDLLFAYAYNHRTTEGEDTVESAWTICKLSSTLSWLHSFSSLPEVVESNFRRALCFPLYRHWDLNRQLVKDVAKILKLGRTVVVKCLLEVHGLLAHHETQYILNDLYLTDYCVWAQYVDQAQLSNMAAQLKQVKMRKSRVGLQLVELEQAALLVVREEEGVGDQLAQEMSQLGVVQQEGYPDLFNRDCGLEGQLARVTIGGGGGRTGDDQQLVQHPTTHAGTVHQKGYPDLFNGPIEGDHHSTHTGTVHQKGYPDLFHRGSGLEDHVKVGHEESEQDCSGTNQAGAVAVLSTGSSCSEEDKSHSETGGNSQNSGGVRQAGNDSEDSGESTSSSCSEDSSDDEEDSSSSCSEDSSDDEQVSSSSCSEDSSDDEAVSSNSQNSRDEEVSSNGDDDAVGDISKESSGKVAGSNGSCNSLDHEEGSSHSIKPDHSQTDQFATQETHTPCRRTPMTENQDGRG